MSKRQDDHRLLRPGGYIIADNVLRSGLVAQIGAMPPAAGSTLEETENWKEGDLEQLDEYNNKANEEGRLETFLMPLFDGLGHIRLLD
jgi:predicted O-methyltransferase YrrM